MNIVEKMLPNLPKSLCHLGLASTMLYCLSSFLMLRFSSDGDRHREYCSMVMSSAEEPVSGLLFSAVVVVE